MTPNSAYLQWLDREIEKCDKRMKIPACASASFAIAMERHSALAEAREKFLSLHPSQEVNTEK